MTIKLVSFGYHWGKYQTADIYVNIRQWPGPTKSQRNLDGRSSRCAGDLFKTPEFVKNYNRLYETILQQIRYQIHFRTIAIGCEKGRHRSVAVVEKLAEDLRTAGYDIVIHHQDVDKVPESTRRCDDEWVY